MKSAGSHDEAHEQLLEHQMHCALDQEVLTLLSDPCAEVHTLTASESNFVLSYKHSSEPTERKERRLAR